MARLTRRRAAAPLINGRRVELGLRGTGGPHYRVSVSARGREGRDLGLSLLRAIEMTSNGEIDGDVSRTAYITQRFPDLVALTVPSLQCDLAVYGRDPDLPQSSRAEIANNKTACIRRGSVIFRNCPKECRSRR